MEHLISNLSRSEKQSNDKASGDKEFADVERLKDQLIQIAADGRICEKEVADFKEIMKEMIELERWIVELKYFAMRHGIEVDDIMPEKDKKRTA